MNRKCCAAALAAAALLSSSPAAAQDAPITLTPAAPRLWDISGDIGWFNSKRSNIAPTWDEWYHAPAASGSVGYYVTPRLRTEFRIAVSGEGRTYQEERTLPGEPFPIYRLREHYFQTASAGVGVYHQFFENQWFHPFAGGGLDIERESHRTLSPELRLPPRPGQPPIFVPPLVSAATVSYAARPFVATGFKWYVNDRAFVKSDLKVSIGRDRNTQTTWSAGIGVDL